MVGLVNAALVTCSYPYDSDTKALQLCLAQKLFSRSDHWLQFHYYSKSEHNMCGKLIMVLNLLSK
jgi:hypothetical protein